MIPLTNNTPPITKESKTLPDDVVLRVDNVSKKFCRNLKQSMKYGIKDLALGLFGMNSSGEDLRKNEFWAVKDVSFELKRGECLGLIGRNGCGKTTLLRLLAGIFPPDKGEISVKGRVGALISLGAGFHPHMTGRENVYLNGSILGLSKKEIDAQFDEILDFAEIGEFIDAPVSSYSSGMRVRLGFAVATATQPDLLLIDEVLAVGDAVFRAKSYNRLCEVARKCAMLFVSHNMSEVARVSDRIIVLDDGIKVCDNESVGEGIVIYEGMANRSNREVEGSGEIIISQVAFKNSDGASVETLEWGQAFGVCFHTECIGEIHDRRVEFLAIIHGSSGNNVAELRQSLPLCILNKWEPALFRVDLTFPALYLADGMHTLSVSLIAGDKGRIVSRVRGACRVVVKGGSRGYAPLVLKASSVEVRKVGS